DRGGDALASSVVISGSQRETKSQSWTATGDAGVWFCFARESGATFASRFQEGDASKYGSTARASNFSSAALRSSVTLGNRSCTSCAAMPQNSTELPRNRL
ncbi:MAG TPA: hypothetical protein VNZ48_22020, partial [Xanthobacteraceae bacterium]|nr:hypothetical protein [Xanthobacteraceae bacterium]